MPNSYVNDLTSTSTVQVRTVYNDVAVLLSDKHVISVVTTNSVGIGLAMVAFNNVATGAAFSKPAAATGTSTTAQSNVSATATSGDLCVGQIGVNNGTVVLSALLDNAAGNTMTQVAATMQGQSVTSIYDYLVESVATTYRPRATLDSSLSWVDGVLLYHNNGSAITAIANSAASQNPTADPGNKTFTIAIPAGVTIPVGAKLLLFVTATSNSGTLTITDNAGFLPHQQPALLQTSRRAAFISH